MKNCPVSDLPITEKPHWQVEHAREGYSTKFTLVGPDIIHGQIITDHDVTMDFIDHGLFQTVISESDQKGKPIFMLHNLNHVKKISFLYKKDLINILYNSGPVFKLLVVYNIGPEIRSVIETFAAIAPEESNVMLADSYRDGLRLIMNAKKGLPETPDNGKEKNPQYLAHKKEFLAALARMNWLNLLSHPITMPEPDEPVYPFFKALEALQQDLREKEQLHRLEIQQLVEEYNRKITEKNILLNAQESLNKKIEQQLEKQKTALTAQIAAKDMELTRVSTIIGEKKSKIEKICGLISGLDVEPETKKQLNTSCRELVETSLFEKHVDHEITSGDSEFLSKLQRRHSALNQRDLRIALLIRRNYNTAEIARSIGITTRGVESIRYRMHKKLGLSKHESIKQYLFRITDT
ncbi:hypothetical protein CHL67_09875 [Prosthecochloris sp. GSB1]|nr:hypothetical protein CHL67_09875 [Prosthecochloris sp. GSB1]